MQTRPNRLLIRSRVWGGMIPAHAAVARSSRSAACIEDLSRTSYEGQPKDAASRMGVGPLHSIDDVAEGNEVMEKRERQDGITTEPAKGRTLRWHTTSDISYTGCYLFNPDTLVESGQRYRRPRRRWSNCRF